MRGAGCLIPSFLRCCIFSRALNDGLTVGMCFTLRKTRGQICCPMMSMGCYCRQCFRVAWTAVLVVRLVIQYQLAEWRMMGALARLGPGKVPRGMAYPPIPLLNMQASVDDASVFGFEPSCCSCGSVPYRDRAPFLDLSILRIRQNGQIPAAICSAVPVCGPFQS